MSTAQAELDAVNEMQAAGEAQARHSAADEEAARQMQAMMDAQSASASAAPAQRERLCLAVRTSLLCEFRNSGGVLQAFEVCYGQTTFGALCGALSRMPGVEFLDHDPHAWFRRPSRFTFRGQLYEVGIPYENIRVGPVDLGQALIEMEEILEYVRHNVLRSRASRYTVR